MKDQLLPFPFPSPYFTFNSTLQRPGHLFIKTGDDRLDEGVPDELTDDLPSYEKYQYKEGRYAGTPSDAFRQ